jgi:hypothetical protein
MMLQPFCSNTTSGLGKTLEFLNDLHEALEENSYSEEAGLVSKHIEQLKSPQVESRILLDGITPVLEELSRGFNDDAEYDDRVFE